MKEEAIEKLSSTLNQNKEDWVKEKVSVVNQLSNLKLTITSIEDALKEEKEKNNRNLILKEELEIELDRIQNVKLN